MALLDIIPGILSQATRGPVLAEDRLLPGFFERLLWRKLPLKLDESAAITD
jgi:hypothetical protein